MAAGDMAAAHGSRGTTRQSIKTIRPVIFKTTPGYGGSGGYPEHGPISSAVLGIDERLLTQPWPPRTHMRDLLARGSTKCFIQYLNCRKMLSVKPSTAFLNRGDR
jgi:hypothetical protein